MDPFGDSPQLTHWVHRILLGGVVLSGGLLLAGLVILLVTDQPLPEGSPSLAVVFRQAVQGNGVGLLELGLLILMATPVLRVGVLALGWWRLGNRRFAVVALGVLVLLGVSLALGLG